MTHAELLGEVGDYQLTIEPIRFRTLLSKYSHVLVIRENGLRVDGHSLLYLSPNKELGLSDSDGQVSWYRSGVCHVPGPQSICTHKMSFADWLFRIISHVRDLLLSNTCPLAR